MTRTVLKVARRKNVRGNDWRSAYQSRLLWTDLLVLVWVVFGVQIAWLGIEGEAARLEDGPAGITINYTAISLAIILGWMGALRFYDSRSDRAIGIGSAEYKALVNASVRLFGIVAIIAFLFKIDLARGYILIAFPVGVLVLLISRWMWRQWLGVQRLRGEYCSTVLLAGSERSVTDLAVLLAGQPRAGYRVVGACLPGGRATGVLSGTLVPVVGDLSTVAEELRSSGADTVVITSSDELPPDRVRELSWALEPGRQHLVVAPSITGIAGPRIHTRPVAGLPLIHVETPRYDGQKIFAKRAFDLLAGLALIAALSPLLILIIVGIRITSPGPVFFHQERVGKGGAVFSMLKFRSMVVDAEARLESLQTGSRSEGNQVMFKMKDDPRVTPLGKILRRFSLDELPQLFNVLAGTMSLVGPRPPLTRELTSYEDHVHRRFLVKPGITGLWQVSGRSNLSWEDTVRLDLYYVENWSFVGDLVILWRTMRAVVARDGAY